MTHYLDGDRLVSWLEEQRNLLAESAKERHEADGPDDHTALRMDGGVANMTMILNQIRGFVVKPGESKTPIKDIRTPAKAKVRRNDPGTSWEAATQHSPGRSKRLYEAIYRLLSRIGPMTDDELRKQMTRRGFEFHAAESVTKRRGELRDAGWVRATEQRRKSDDGGMMTVWEAVPENG